MVLFVYPLWANPFSLPQTSFLNALSEYSARDDLNYNVRCTKFVDYLAGECLRVAEKPEATVTAYWLLQSAAAASPNLHNFHHSACPVRRY